MKEHPAPFKSQMVLAILDDRKNQTRRVITPHNSTVNGYPGQQYDWSKFDWKGEALLSEKLSVGITFDRKAPAPWTDGDSKKYYQYIHVPYDWPKQGTIYRVRPKWEVGDHLWVQEALRWSNVGNPIRYAADIRPVLKDGETPLAWPWLNPVLPSIFMPRWASRITLEIVEVRAQPVQDITSDDAFEEGMTQGIATQMGLSVPVSEEEFNFTKTRRTFQYYWDHINAKRGFPWANNDWVWAYSFRRLG